MIKNKLKKMLILKNTHQNKFMKCINKKSIKIKAIQKLKISNKYRQKILIK